MYDNTLLEVVGWVGSFLFSACAIPQAYHSWKNKNSEGLTWAFLIMWFVGEVLTFIYVISKPDPLIPLLLNYAFNFMMLLIILKYKVWPTTASMDTRPAGALDDTAKSSAMVGRARYALMDQLNNLPVKLKIRWAIALVEQLSIEIPSPSIQCTIYDNIQLDWSWDDSSISVEGSDDSGIASIYYKSPQSEKFVLVNVAAAAQVISDMFAARRLEQLDEFRGEFDRHDCY